MWYVKVPSFVRNLNYHTTQIYYSIRPINLKSGFEHMVLLGVEVKLIKYVIRRRISKKPCTLYL